MRDRPVKRNVDPVSHCPVYRLPDVGVGELQLFYLFSACGQGYICKVLDVNDIEHVIEHIEDQ